MEDPSFGDATALVTSLFTGYFILVLQRRFAKHHLELGVEFCCILSKTHISAVLWCTVSATTT